MLRMAELPTLGAPGQELIAREGCLALRSMEQVQQFWGFPRDSDTPHSVTGGHTEPTEACARRSGRRTRASRRGDGVEEGDGEGVDEGSGRGADEGGGSDEDDDDGDARGGGCLSTLAHAGLSTLAEESLCAADVPPTDRKQSRFDSETGTRARQAEPGGQSVFCVVSVAGQVRTERMPSAAWLDRLCGQRDVSAGGLLLNVITEAGAADERPTGRLSSHCKALEVADFAQEGLRRLERGLQKLAGMRGVNGRRRNEASSRKSGRKHQLTRSQCP